MPRIMFVNHTCPICKDRVDYDPDYNPKTAAGHGNVEWVLTKRGLKQYFHTQCYYSMIEAQKIEKCLSKKELVNV